ncbi:MAG: tetratricopeptide repeat protein [Candidatus Aminicenantes bacterium]|nr:tetratricopeptide repeat protein [Candidatus Aminicenantes bacterium]
MKKIFLIVPIMVFCFNLSLQADLQSGHDETLFREAKILLFDEKWEQAQEKLDILLDEYPDSRFYAQSLFYKGVCLKEVEGREEEAIQVYKTYLDRKDRSPNLSEDAEASIIDLAVRLYRKGKRSALKEVSKRLSHPKRVIKYYAAFELSFIEDKRAAAEAIPVLKEILENETDSHIQDRAKLAILRIDPNALKDFVEDRYQRKARILHIRVYTKGKNEPDFAVNFPFALADLALSVIPEEDKEAMRREGYDIDEILRRLNEFTGEIIRIEAEGKIFEMWID